MAMNSSSLYRFLPTLSKEWLYVVLIITLGIISIQWCSIDRSDKRKKAQLVTKHLWTRYVYIPTTKQIINDMYLTRRITKKSREIPTTFAPTSWQRQAFDAFRARMLLEDPQVFPCIYATKGFKANEHRCCFIANLDSDPGSATLDTALDTLAAAFDNYAENWRKFGPMTSLVVLTPLPAVVDEWKLSLEDDRRHFWDLLRAITERNPHEQLTHVPQAVKELAWTLKFRGERFVALALTPRYQKRQSRFCAGFVLAFQPIEIFQDLLSTPEKMANAVGKVRALTDSLDAVPYSEDVIAVGDGRQSVSTMFFLSDDGESWGSLFSKV